MAEHASLALETSPRPWGPQLTTSSLQQLRRTRSASNGTGLTSPVSPIMSRRTSFESDRYSTVSGLTSYFPNNPTNVNPAPVYVAPFGAAQVVGELLAAERPGPLSSDDDEEEERLNKDDVQFTPPALSLVNAFLDQLLYSFLATARSTSLLALRPAVTEVLKNRLAKEAIASADDELDGLLAGGDDEEEDASRKTTENKRQWDLELVWKRTRLRVMVYTRLGEMEDDDEERYVKDEELFNGNERRFSRSSGLVSWAAAIFLTSVLEYVAEQTLQAAGQASCNRAQRESRARRLAGTVKPQQSDALVVEQHDVEKVALHNTLGRLWRTWRKALRNNAAPGVLGYRPSLSNGRTSRENVMSALSNRRSSFSTAHEGSVASESPSMSREGKEEPDVEYPEHILAANIPLPIGDAVKDVDEITVPGLAADPDMENDVATGADEPYPTELLGSLVPIPLTDEKRDIDEIEIPGLARDPDAPAVFKAAAAARRRHSFTEWQPSAAPRSAHEDVEAQDDMPFASRQRSMSVPTPEKRAAVGAGDEEDEYSDALETLQPTVYSGNPDIRAAPAAAAPSSETQEKEVADVPEDQVSDSTGRGQFPWMTAAAVGSGAAASAAIGTWASNPSTKENPESSVTSNPPGTESFPNEERHVPEKAPQEFADNQVDDLDERKSLVDMKSMMIVNGPSNPASPGIEEPPSLNAREGAQEDDAIGVARTSDVAAVAPMGAAHEARETYSRPTKLIIGEPPPPPPEADSPTIGPPSSSKQRQMPTMTSGASQAQEMQSESMAYTESSLTNGTQYPPRNQSLAMDADRATVASRKSGSSGSFSRPMSKANDKSAKSPRLVSNPAALHALTSASIRGPEDFDTFVQSSDTVKYTLTPETVRDDTNWTAFSTPQSRQAPVEMDAVSQAYHASRSGRSFSSQQSTPANTTGSGQTSIAEKRRSAIKPPPKNVSSRRSGLLAREPQVMTESTRDFADWIRSTGPKKEPTLAPILPGGSQTSLQSLRSGHIHGASTSGASTHSSDRVKGQQGAPPVPLLPKKSRPAMEPRGGKATAPSSSDLIDFIRSGPSEEGSRRISRSVAPFRNTMDSDQIRESFENPGSHNTDTISEPRLLPSAASIQTPSMTPSMRSSQRTSTNSRSALLNPSNSTNYTAQPAYSGQPQKLSSGYGTNSRNAVPPTNNVPRKQTRNKDPYALDFLDLDLDDDDDEDDDNLGILPKSTANQTLAEFLSSTEPPRNNDPLPVIDPNSAQAKAAVSRMRSTQNGSRSRSEYATAAPILPPVSSTNGSLTSQKMLPRGGAKEIAANSNTQALADFLRASGPPDDPDSAPAPTVGGRSSRSVKSEKKNGLGRLFSRSSAKPKATYLDMP